MSMHLNITFKVTVIIFGLSVVWIKINQNGTRHTSMIPIIFIFKNCLIRRDIFKTKLEEWTIWDNIIFFQDF